MFELPIHLSHARALRTPLLPPLGNFLSKLVKKYYNSILLIHSSEALQLLHSGVASVAREGAFHGTEAARGDYRSGRRCP